MKKALLIAALVALLFISYEGYTIMTDRMKGTRWDRLVPEMKEKTLELLKRAAEAGLSVMFFEGWRSVEDEQADIEKGTSKLKDPYNTHHLWGAAVDIVFKSALGQPSWPDPNIPENKAKWDRLIEIGKGVGLTHPISWDYPHFELPGFSISDVRAEYGTDFAAYLADNGVQTA